MAKLTRVPAKVFAASAAATEIGQFGSAVAGSKLETADVATIQGLSAWLSGWSEALVSGNRYPALQEMNGLLKVLSYQGAYTLQEGIPEYDSATTYYIGSIVKKTGTFELYGSLTNDNVGNALTVGANWKLLVDLNTVGQSVVQIGTSSTASATTEKVVTLSGFVLTTGATIQVTFTNVNTATTPTLNVNDTGAKSIKFKDGLGIDATHLLPAQAGETLEFYYDGGNWVIPQRAKYDSGWFPVYANSSYTKTHNLGTANIKYIMLVADNANGLNQRKAYDFGYWYSSGNFGWLPDATTATTISFHIQTGVDFGGAGAYYRILAEVL